MNGEKIGNFLEKINVRFINLFTYSKLLRSAYHFVAMKLLSSLCLSLDNFISQSLYVKLLSLCNNPL